MRKKFHLSYKLGYYKIYDIFFFYENNFLKVEVFIQHIQIKLVWLRIRFSLVGARVITELKTRINPHNAGEEKENSNEQLLNDGIKKTTPPIPSSDSFMKPSLDEKFFEKKDEFIRILKQLFQKQNYSNENLKYTRIDKNLDSVEGILKNKKNDIKLLEKILRNFILLFDIQLKDIKIVLKIEERKFSHKVSLENVLIGATNMKNKV